MIGNMFNRVAGILSRSRAYPVIGPLHRIQQFHATNYVRNSNVFGEITQTKPTSPIDTKTSSSENDELTVENDFELQQYHKTTVLEQQIRGDKYITPLKRELFNQVVKEHGFYKNNMIVNSEDGKTYKLTLTNEEIEILEPSIYLSSYRIKSSMKKATQVNRFVRGYTVKNAINQLHFNPKKISNELEILLKRGLDQAKELKLDEDSMYIDALWVGSDGQWQKRVDIKGRSRMGVIKHPYIHLKVILKSKLTKLRKQWEKQQKLLNEKPRMYLNNEPLNFKVRSNYKW